MNPPKTGVLATAVVVADEARDPNVGAAEAAAPNPPNEAPNVGAFWEAAAAGFSSSFFPAVLGFGVPALAGLVDLPEGNLYKGSKILINSWFELNF